MGDPFARLRGEPPVAIVGDSIYIYETRTLVRAVLFGGRAPVR